MAAMAAIAGMVAQSFFSWFYWFSHWFYNIIVGFLWFSIQKTKVSSKKHEIQFVLQQLRNIALLGNHESFRSLCVLQRYHWTYPLNQLLCCWPRLTIMASNLGRLLGLTCFGLITSRPICLFEFASPCVVPQIERYNFTECSL